MKVKHFTEITSTIVNNDFENAINKFIQDKEIVDIKYLANSTQGEAGIVTTFSVLIVYKEN